MKLLGIFVKFLFSLLLMLFIALVAFMHFAPTFGAAPSGPSLARISESANFNGTRFENLVDTQVSTPDPDNPASLTEFFWPPAGKNPTTALRSEKFEKNGLANGSFVWLGHSTLLFNVADLVVMTDPVFHRASPVPFIGEPFAVSSPTVIDDLPAVDVVLISHDHYDHLDHRAIQKLEPVTAQFIVPLGVAAHLQSWGVPSNKITELDWYESKSLNGVEFVFTPARHFSGRGFSNGFSTLWGSWAVIAPDLRVWFSGDGGYFDELVKIGNTYGPFDIAFVENGAYDGGWREIHMTPEQAVQASVDVGAEVFFPIHWGKFDLALHPWDEPVIRAHAAAQQLQVRMLTPIIGKVFTPQDNDHDEWWLDARE